MTTPDAPPEERPCPKCGPECPCRICHTDCGLDHSPTLPPGQFPTTALCNPHCPEEAFLPYLVGLPGMQGASMLMPLHYLKIWSRRLWDGGARLTVDPVIFYHPPAGGDLNPGTAAGEWKDTPPDPAAAHGVDINKLSGALQAELKRQFDERDAANQPPPAMPEKRQFVEHITRFDPRHHTVREVLAHLRTATEGEIDRVVRLERNGGSQRAGILKRYEGRGL
jgi:hypothetical protein